jgi:predicted metal-dependent peptidase
MWANILKRVRTESGAVLGYQVRVNKTAREYKVMYLPVKKCIELTKNKTILNAIVVVQENGKEHLRAKLGTFPEGIVKVKAKTVSYANKQNKPKEANFVIEPTHDKPIEQTTEEVKEESNQTQAINFEEIYTEKVGGSITNSSFERSSKIKDKHSDLTVEQKLVKSMITLRKLRPFYGILYQGLKRVEKDVPTMAVSIDTLFINPEFVAELTFPELLFVNMHELLHISLMHNERGKGKNLRVYNLACDLIINKMLVEEFNLDRKNVTRVTGLGGRTVDVQIPKGLLLDESIDTSVENAETLYEKLMKELKKQQQNGGGNSVKLPNGESVDSNDQQGGLGNDLQPDMQENEEDNGSGQSEEQNGIADENGNRDENGEEQNGIADENGNSDENGIGNNENDCNQSGEDKHDKDQNTNKSSKSNKGSKFDPKTKLKDKERVKKIKDKIRGCLTNAKLAGSQAGNIERLIEDSIAPVVDWKKLVKRYLTATAERYLSLTSPDKRYLHSGLMLPGEAKIEPSMLERVKVCIDTSGSIADTDLGVFYKQLNQLLKLYKMDAEVIYWDTEVAQTGMFSDIKEFAKIKAAGGGGTDVNCVFKYFDSKECKIKPYVIIVFTDGHFYTNIKKWRYSKNVIWVIQGNEKAFKPPFGKVAKFIR